MCPRARRPQGTYNRNYDATRESSSARGYDARWRRLRESQLRAEPLCRSCRMEGLAVAATEVDHIRRKRRGGGDERRNLQSLCRACHSKKTNEEIREDRIIH